VLVGRFLVLAELAGGSLLILTSAILASCPIVSP
jgi:hypothetical protein